MTVKTSYDPGTFSWADMGTTDVKAAKAFYTGLFDWEGEDTPAGDAGIYTMFKQRGHDVAACYRMSDELRSRGIPPHWLAYVTVQDVEESTSRAEGLGGTVLAKPFDVMDAGRMSLIADPSGAQVAMWQARSNIGATLINEPGSLTWNELLTNDTDKAAAFYGDLFGWGTRTFEPPPEAASSDSYTMFTLGENQVAGMMGITSEMGPMPPSWMIYLAVDDCDARASKATELGGKILMPPTDFPEVGRGAVVQDPQGAPFSIIALANPPA